MSKSLIKNVSVNPDIDDKSHFNIFITYWNKRTFVRHAESFEEAINIVELQLRKDHCGKTEHIIDSLKSWRRKNEQETI